MIQIIAVNNENFSDAVQVYSASWKRSHAGICTPDFLMRRDYSGYLQKRMAGLYLIYDQAPVGIFYLAGREFGDLYIHPDCTGRGYGTACIHYAKRRCPQLRLTVLSSNTGAIRLYERHGFRFSESDIPLKNGLWEREMIYTEKNHG